MDYLKNGPEIYQKSFALIRAETDFSPLPAVLHPVAERMIHACGMVDLPADMAFSEDFTEAARTALQNGGVVLCDANMVASGVTRARLPADNAVLCFLKQPKLADLAARLATTRSAAALDFWGPYLENAVVVIGNAPTALFRLLEGLDAGWPRPAAIIGLPVGFVGAIEAKEELAKDSRGVPFLTLRGRRGGSAMAAAAVNALAQTDL